MERTALKVFGIFLIMVGLFLVITSLLQFIPASPLSGGVVVLIGPLPLSFGFGPYGLQMLVVALSLALFMMAILFILFAWSRRSVQWS
ncbi:TIGR00304 family membrane protein [Tardisphaera saccharovorans]